MDHVIEIREDGWAVEHPQSCRDSSRSLLDCPVTLGAQSLASPPRPNGRYYCQEHHRLGLIFGEALPDGSNAE